MSTLDPKKVEAIGEAAFKAIESSRSQIDAHPEWESKKTLNMIHLLVASAITFRADSLVAFSHKHVRGSKELPCGAPFLDRATQVYKDMRIWVWAKHGTTLNVNIFNNQALQFANLGCVTVADGTITLYSITQTKESRKKAKFEACTLLFTNHNGRVCAVNTLKNYHPHKSGDLTSQDTCFKAEASSYIINNVGDISVLRFPRELIQKTFTLKDYKQFFDMWDKNPTKSSAALPISTATSKSSDTDEQALSPDVHYFPPQPSYAAPEVASVKITGQEDQWFPYDAMNARTPVRPDDDNDCEMLEFDDPLASSLPNSYPADAFRAPVYLSYKKVAKPEADVWSFTWPTL